MNEPRLSFIGTPSMDDVLRKEGMMQGKTINALETADEQCRALNSLPDRLGIFVLLRTLEGLERLRSQASEGKDWGGERTLVQKYICGQIVKPLVEGTRTLGHSPKERQEIGRD